MLPPDTLNFGFRIIVMDQSLVHSYIPIDEVLLILLIDTEKSPANVHLHCLCIIVNIRGTHRTEIFFIFKFSVNMRCTAP